MGGSNDNMGVMADAVVRMAMNSGYRLEEIIPALGLATKMLALLEAAEAGDDTPDEALAYAVKLLAAGLKQTADVIPDESQ